jgi:predicted MPP superfamily phosphohydrolase
MKENKSRLITRRQAIFSIAAISAGALIRPVSSFCAPVRDKLRFAVVGDWGTGDQDCAGIARQMLASKQSSSLDFVIAAGDNIYPNGSGRYFSSHFERPFAGIIKDRVPFYAVLGNHDVEEGRQDQCQYPLFNMAGKNYYSIKQGDNLAELFMLDSTDLDRQQINWIDEALKNTTAKWKIVVLHHPIYSSGKKHGSAMGLRKQLEPLFVRYGVNAVFSGHDHIYERTKLQQGVQYFVTGAGGKTRRGDIDLKSSFREVSYDEDNHFMVIDIEDKQINFQAISEAGIIVDRGSISSYRA